MSNPLFSIVTVNYNDAEGLERTIKSVLQQDFTDYEHIIIDGASTDTSVNIIKQYQPLYPQGVLTWLSESDGGIYHAMNKGIALAKGTWLNMMNAGDWFDSHALSTVTTYINQNPQSQVFISPVRIRENPKSKEYALAPYCEEVIYPSRLHYSPLPHLYHRPLYHQGIFYKASLHLEYGHYREDLQYASDYAFELDILYKTSTPFTVISQCFINFTDGGIGNSQDAYQEIDRMHIEYGFKEPKPQEPKPHKTLKRIILKTCKWLLPFGVWALKQRFRNKRT